MMVRVYFIHNFSGGLFVLTAHLKKSCDGRFDFVLIFGV